MTGRTHVALERIVEHLVGESKMTPAEEAHLSSCGRCAALERRLSALRSAAADAGEPPAAWVRRAEAIPDRGAATGRAELVRLATVLHDGAIGRAAGVRSAETGRQWLLAADDVEIELSAGTTLDGTWSLSGQLVTPDPAREVAGCTVELESADGTTTRVRASDLGDFVLEARLTGPFRLRFSGNGWEIRTPPLEP